MKRDITSTSIQEIFETCLMPQQYSKLYLNKAKADFLSSFIHSDSSIERKKLIVILAKTIKNDKLSYPTLKENKLARIINRRLYLCPDNKSKHTIDYSKLMSREPDHLLNPIFFAMPLSQYPFGLAVPYNLKRILMLETNNELNKIPDPYTHFIWLSLNNREIDILDNNGIKEESDEDISLSLMSISFQELSDDDSFKNVEPILSLKKRKRKNPLNIYNKNGQKKIVKQTLALEKDARKKRVSNTEYNCLKDRVSNLLDSNHRNRVRRHSGVLGNKVKQLKASKEQDKINFIIKTGKKKKKSRFRPNSKSSAMRPITKKSRHDKSHDKKVRVVQTPETKPTDKGDSQSDSDERDTSLERYKEHKTPITSSGMFGAPFRSVYPQNQAAFPNSINIPSKTSTPKVKEHKKKRITIRRYRARRYAKSLNMLPEDKNSGSEEPKDQGNQTIRINRPPSSKLPQNRSSIKKKRTKRPLKNSRFKFGRIKLKSDKEIRIKKRKYKPKTKTQSMVLDGLKDFQKVLSNKVKKTEFKPLFFDNVLKKIHLENSKQATFNRTKVMAELSRFEERTNLLLYKRRRDQMIKSMAYCPQVL